MQGGLGIFSASEGWGFEVLHSRKPAGWSQIAILLFLSVTPPWLLASGLGNTCWVLGAHVLVQAAELSDQIVIT